MYNINSFTRLKLHEKLFKIPTSPSVFTCRLRNLSYLGFLQKYVTTAYDISKIGGGKEEKSKHLCIAEVSQTTIAQFATQQLYQKHSCPKNPRILLIIRATLQKEKCFPSEMHYDNKNDFLAIL